MPVSDPDTYSLCSQVTSIGDSLSAQIVRRSARKGFTFNIMSVGPRGLGKTTLLSSLFGKNLEVLKEKPTPSKDPLNPPVIIDSKTFEIDEKKVRLRLTVVQCKNYGDALCLKNTHLPLVEYIDMQFADYHKRESSFDRRNISDHMIHCLFFFISPFSYGLTKLDLEFLKSVHNRVNIIPIIARAEALTLAERAAFKRRVRDVLEKNKIQVYEIDDPDAEDTDDIKKIVEEIKDAWPFAVTSMNMKSDGTLTDLILDCGTVDPLNKDHSDFVLLKTMLHMQMADLCEATHERFYEEYRLRKTNQKLSSGLQ